MLKQLVVAVVLIAVTVTSALAYNDENTVPSISEDGVDLVQASSVPDYDTSDRMVSTEDPKVEPAHTTVQVVNYVKSVGSVSRRKAAAQINYIVRTGKPAGESKDWYATPGRKKGQANQWSAISTAQATANKGVELGLKALADSKSALGVANIALIVALIALLVGFIGWFFPRQSRREERRDRDREED